MVDDRGTVRKVWVHRKGATRAFPPGRPEIPAKYRDVGQPVLIPGSMRLVSWRPVDKAALYVPARYISTLVMLAVPASLAGVREIYVVTPPRGVTEELLAVAKELGVKGVLQIGGPHGLAYAVFHIGVDVVAGPGGLYVQAGKYVLSQYVGVDGIEGPTELVVYAEGVAPEVAAKGAMPFI